MFFNFFFFFNLKAVPLCSQLFLIVEKKASSPSSLSLLLSSLSRFALVCSCLTNLLFFPLFLTTSHLQIPHSCLCLTRPERLGYRCLLLPFPVCSPLSTLSFLLRCAKDSAHTCRVSHTKFATCETLKRTFPLPYTPLHLAVERIHAWGAPGDVFVHFKLVVTCSF